MAREFSEATTNPEQNEKAKVVLHIFRHSKGEPKGEGIVDAQRQLKPEGRELAARQSMAQGGTYALAFGSPRIRAQQTAAIMMQPELGQEKDHAALLKKLNQGLEYGSRVGEDERLDFDDNFSTPYGKIWKSHFDKTYLTYVVNGSDADAVQLGDKDAITYSRMASNVASLVLKYTSVSKQWDKMTIDEPEKYSSATLERFMGSHGGVPESFLAKVIELTKGKSERDNFVAAVGECFRETEGIDVEIMSDEQNPTITIRYTKEENGNKVYEFNETVPLELIKKIYDSGKPKSDEVT